MKKQMKPFNILFVRSGCKEPHFSLEEAIIHALKTTVRKLHIASPHQDILRIALKTRPDLILVFNGTGLSPIKVSTLKRHGFKTAVWLTDDPYHTDLTKIITPYYHFIFTPEISCVPFYKSLACEHVYHLPLAANENVFYPKNVNPMYETDILFVGSAFWNRVQFFDTIAPYLITKNTLISGLWWDRLRNYPLLKEKIHLNCWMSAEETANYYNGAKIVLNMHRSHNDQSSNQNTANLPALSINPRTFEIAACGAFQLTDIRQDLENYYKPSLDIETYSTSEELIEKIEYYLHHEEERKQITLRALTKTQNEHTFQKRLLYLLHFIFKKDNPIDLSH